MPLLRLVSSQPSDRQTPISRVACKMLSVRSPPSSSTLGKKLYRLAALNPAAIAVVERLIDHLLRHEET